MDGPGRFIGFADPQRGVQEPVFSLRTICLRGLTKDSLRPIPFARVLSGPPGKHPRFPGGPEYAGAYDQDRCVTTKAGKLTLFTLRYPAWCVMRMHEPLEVPESRLWTDFLIYKFQYVAERRFKIAAPAPLYQVSAPQPSCSASCAPKRECSLVSSGVS